MSLLEIIIWKVVFPGALGVYVIFSADTTVRSLKILRMFKASLLEATWKSWDGNIPPRFCIPLVSSALGSIFLVNFSSERSPVYFYLFYFYQQTISIALLVFSWKLYPLLGKRGLWFLIPALSVSLLFAAGLFVEDYSLQKAWISLI